MQLGAIFAPLGADAPRRILIVCSYLLLLLFVAANRRRPGLVILGLGLFLNLLPIFANGGLMPVTPETLDRAHISRADVQPGDWIRNSKDVLKQREDAHLWFLSDRLVWADLPGFRVFSIGDLFIAGGLLVTLGDLFLPRLKTVRPDRPAA